MAPLDDIQQASAFRTHVFQWNVLLMLMLMLLGGRRRHADDPSNGYTRQKERQAARQASRQVCRGGGEDENDDQDVEGLEEGDTVSVDGAENETSGVVQEDETSAIIPVSNRSHSRALYLDNLEFFWWVLL